MGIEAPPVPPVAASPKERVVLQNNRAGEPQEELSIVDPCDSVARLEDIAIGSQGENNGTNRYAPQVEVAIGSKGKEECTDINAS